MTDEQLQELAKQATSMRLKQLIEEVRFEKGNEVVPYGYNRIYNRHVSVPEYNRHHNRHNR